MTEHFIDRLLDAADKTAPVCVGVDPLYDQLPAELKTATALKDQHLAAISTFCHQLLEIVAPIVPAVKLQIACFEIYRDEGVKLYFNLIRHARKLGLLVIGDVKRGDIGSTAAAYAAGHLGHDAAPDAVTVNGYFGAEGIEPFAKLAGASGSGLFVLVRTSNPSAAALQDFQGADGKKFYEHVAELVAAMDESCGLVGSRGYSHLGAVVAATYPAQARRLRQIMPRQFFLVPGYGAQGASAEDCAAAFKDDGTGAIVNASRSVIFAYNSPAHAGRDWKKAVSTAAANFAADIADAVRR
jgi:orotidine-5'-phosphate decarboxylase